MEVTGKKMCEFVLCQRKYDLKVAKVNNFEVKILNLDEIAFCLDWQKILVKIAEASATPLRTVVIWRKMCWFLLSYKTKQLEKMCKVAFKKISKVNVTNCALPYFEVISWRRNKTWFFCASDGTKATSRRKLLSQGTDFDLENWIPLRKRSLCLTGWKFVDANRFSPKRSTKNRWNSWNCVIHPRF